MHHPTQYENMSRTRQEDRLRDAQAQRAIKQARGGSPAGRSWLFMILLALGIVGVTAAFSWGQSDLARVRSATAGFHRTEPAQAAGWDLRDGLDHCFFNPGVGAMGYHYINISLLDLELDAEQPEALVYAPGANGQLALAAVGYIVPGEAWDAENNEPPTVLGHSLHLNEPLGVYVLHAWIWKNNPSGMFDDWNPQVSCP